MSKIRQEGQADQEETHLEVLEDLEEWEVISVATWVDKKTRGGNKEETPLEASSRSSKTSSTWAKEDRRDRGLEDPERIEKEKISL